MRSVNDFIALRRLARDDIPRRIDAMLDPAVLRNISTMPVLCDRKLLEKFFVDIVEGRNGSRTEFVVENTSGVVVGYSYLLGIDLPARVCEIGLAIEPRFRFGYGFGAMIKTYEYAFGVLNMRSVLNEVYDVNTMMSSGSTTAGRAQVTAVNAHLTDGELGDNYFWTETRTDFTTRFSRYLGSRPERFDNCANRG